MRGFAALAIMMAGLALEGCTTDPKAPINESFPIRQMDRFFDSLEQRPPSATSPDYTKVPGYAPAYPPYEYRGGRFSWNDRTPSAKSAERPASP